MNYFRSAIQESQKFAWSTEYSAIDYSMINDAEWAAEESTRAYASNKGYDGGFEIWEDGITNAHELTDDQIAELELVYLKAFNNFLEEKVNG